jgi:hypothetical protein
MGLIDCTSSFNLPKVNAETSTLVISESYHWDPANEFDGRVGPVIFTNKSLYPVTVKLWHSDNQKVWRTYEIDGGQTIMLAPNIGSSWGIQIGQSQIYSLAKIATWKKGKFYVSTESFWNQ